MIQINVTVFCWVFRLVDWCFAYCKLHDFDMNPQAHQVFYSACQVCPSTFDCFSIMVGEGASTRNPIDINVFLMCFWFCHHPAPYCFILSGNTTNVMNVTVWLTFNFIWPGGHFHSPLHFLFKARVYWWILNIWFCCSFYLFGLSRLSCTFCAFAWNHWWRFLDLKWSLSKCPWS